MASSALLIAVREAEATRDTIYGQLDEVARLAPPEMWLPEWDTNELRTYVASVRWQHARPPQPPHEYTVRDWSGRPMDFLAAAQVIQSRGVLKMWGAFVHAYLVVDGLEYWTMGARIPETTVINRAPVGAPSAAQALPVEPELRLIRAVERALAYRRMKPVGEPVDTGILGERLLALLPSPAE